MCGIAGIVDYRATRTHEPGELLAIRESMHDRGPDGEGLWRSADGRVGLAHRRLAIIDTRASAGQPMADGSGRLHLVFNGEIYNYRQLRDELQARGARFRTTSDTEVILELYRELGDDLVDRLRGMYAFALWDEDRRRLLMARDPLGIKPLYYADDGTSLRFASQARALLAGGAVSGELSAPGIVGFYLWGHVPEPHTVYRAVRSLPPGGRMSVSLDGHPEQRPPPARLPARPPAGGGVHAPAGGTGDPARLRDILDDSVAAHLVADVPVGAFLSAGIDSSVICALAARTADRPLRTVTLGFTEYRGTPDDEVPLAEQTAAVLGTEHETHWVSREAFTTELSRFLEAMDQPTVDGLNSYLVSAVTARAGLKVALSGVGGDEMFGGYPSFRDVPRLARFGGRLPGAKRWGAPLRAIGAPLLRRLTSPKWAGLFEYGTSMERAYLLRRGLFMPWELPEFLDPDLVRQGWADLQTLPALSDTTAGERTDFARVQALETAWYLQGRLLRDTDWASMAHSLEVRTPLVDATLRASLGAPEPGTPSPSKQWLAAALPEPLRQQLAQRPKTGFSVPVREWAMSSGVVHTRERGLRGWARAVAQSFGMPS